MLHHLRVCPSWTRTSMSALYHPCPNSCSTTSNPSYIPMFLTKPMVPIICQIATSRIIGNATTSWGPKRRSLEHMHLQGRGPSNRCPHLSLHLQTRSPSSPSLSRSNTGSAFGRPRFIPCTRTHVTQRQPLPPLHFHNSNYPSPPPHLHHRQGDNALGTQATAPGACARRVSTEVPPARGVARVKQISARIRRISWLINCLIATVPKREFDISVSEKLSTHKMRGKGFLVRF
jgi:hypothetical protein